MLDVHNRIGHPAKAGNLRVAGIANIYLVRSADNQ